jgi:glycosyltransferase involved in cell wall biosynthesis
MTPPRVLFVIGGLEHGGSESQLVTLLEALHPGAVRAVLATLSPDADGAFARRLNAIGVRRVALGGGAPRAVRMAVAVPGLAALIARVRPDLVYAWLERATLVAAPAASAGRVPLAVARRNVSGPYADWPRPVLAAIARAERRAAIVTANSHAVADASLRRGVAPERIRVVFNGHRAVEPLPAPVGGEVALGYVARFREEKGHLRLLDALARVRARGAWRADLAGDGPLAESVAAQAAARGLADRLRFLGPVGDTRAFWARRDVAVLLSDHEGSPNALIEAAMAGRPIVATAVGGVPDVVGPGAGYVLPGGDVDAIAEALTALVDDRALRERLGAAAYAHASARFSMEHFVAGHRDAIAEAIGQAGRTT